MKISFSSCVFKLFVLGTELLPEIPLWVKTPDYERVDWLNKFLLDMWPFLEKAICGIIRSTTKPIFAEYIGKYQIKSIEFDELSLGNLHPIICEERSCCFHIKKRHLIQRF